MKPCKQTIAAIRKNTDYTFVTAHSFDVYPGWGERYVVQDVDGVFWAADVHLRDDDSDYDEPKEWTRVYPKVITRYEGK